MPTNIDKPYDKLEIYGAECLTNSELLSIILRVNKEVADKLLEKKKSGLANFKSIKKLSIPELIKIDGIGKVKASQIKALFEISKRINGEDLRKSKRIKSPEDVYSFVRVEMEDKSQEVIKTIILNRKNIVQSVITNAVGGQSKIIISPKEILSEPIKQMASSIILVHNHPSGDPTPSNEDINFTKNIINLANLFDIDVLDHLVIGKKCFKSLKELNLM